MFRVNPELIMLILIKIATNRILKHLEAQFTRTDISDPDTAESEFDAGGFQSHVEAKGRVAGRDDKDGNVEIIVARVVGEL